MTSTSVVRRQTVGVLFCLWALAAAASAAPVADLPAAAPATRTLALETVWRVGGWDDEEILLGVVVDGCRDEEGNTYLLDNQLTQVLVISPVGELVATLSREGDGPGELRRPNAVVCLPDGTIGVAQGQPGKLVRLQRDGTPAGDIVMSSDAEEGGFSSLQGIACRGGHLAAVTGRFTFDAEAGKGESVRQLDILDPEGNATATIGSHRREQDLQRFVYDEPAQYADIDVWALAPDGTVYTRGGREVYEIRTHGPDGVLLRTLIRPFDNPRRTDARKETIGADMTVVINGVRQEIERKILDTEPVIGALAVADDGRLFVTNCRSLPHLLETGTAGRFDVIGPDGSFREELTLTLEGFDPEEDRLLFLDGTHFLVLRNIESARAARRAGFGGDEDEEEADPGDVEPLEVLMVRIPGQAPRGARAQNR